MPHCKNTNFFSEIDVFFKNREDSTIQAMITALKAINMTDKRLGLATYHNASLSSSEKLRNLVFLPFLGCKGISHLNYSCVAGSVGYNMLYRIIRLHSIDWRNGQARFNKHLRKYLESHTEKEKDGVVCLVAEDTDIAKSGRKKRMNCYGTLGGLFRNTMADTVEFTPYERILLVLKDILEEYTEFIGFPNKKIVQKFLSENQFLEKIKDSKHLKIRA